MDIVSYVLSKKYANELISVLPNIFTFKGTIGTGGTISELPAAASSNLGHAYKVITAGTYSEISVNVGDAIVSNGTSWVKIPEGDYHVASNIDYDNTDSNFESTNLQDVVDEIGEKINDIEEEIEENALPDKTGNIDKFLKINNEGNLEWANVEGIVFFSLPNEEDWEDETVTRPFYNQLKAAIDDDKFIIVIEKLYGDYDAWAYYTVSWNCVDSSYEDSKWINLTLFDGWYVDMLEVEPVRITKTESEMKGEVVIELDKTDINSVYNELFHVTIGQNPVLHEEIGYANYYWKFINYEEEESTGAITDYIFLCSKNGELHKLVVSSNFYQETIISNQASTMPTANAYNLGQIIQYIGITNDNYTNGFFYKCTESSGVYSWESINVQSGSGGTNNYDDLINKPMSCSITKCKYYNMLYFAVFDDSDDNVVSTFNKLISGDYPQITLKFGNKKEVVLEWSDITNYYGIYQHNPDFYPLSMFRFDNTYYNIQLLNNENEDYLPNNEFLTISTDDGDITTIIPTITNDFNVNHLTVEGAFDVSLDKQKIKVCGIEYESESKVGVDADCYWDFSINSRCYYRLACNNIGTDKNNIKLDFFAQRNLTSIDDFQWYNNGEWIDYKIPIPLPTSYEEFYDVPSYRVSILQSISTDLENIKINIDGEDCTLDNINGEIELIGYYGTSSDYTKLYLLVAEDDYYWDIICWKYNEQVFSPIKDYYFTNVDVTINEMYKSAFLLSNNPTGYGSFSLNKGSGQIGECSFTEGIGSLASGYYSHAEGCDTVANGESSHAEGFKTIANGECSHVQGKYNIEDEDEKYAMIIGNGTDDDDRSNALTVDWEGNLVCNNIPAPPTSDGTYTLKCTISDGVASYSWVSE